MQFAIVYGVVAVLLLVTLIPLAVDRRSSQRADHRSQAQERASAFAAFIDKEAANMFGARELLRGFVKSSAPLHAPNYTSMNVSERVAVALSSSSATGAMSPESYARITRIVNNSFAGYRNAIVYAGLVAAFSESGGSHVQIGTDILAAFPDEFEYCVRNAHGFIGLPRVAAGTSRPNYIIVLRSPIFTDFHRIVVGDPNRINPATGKHVNWDYLWGAITVIMDMSDFSLEMRRRVASSNDTDFEWMLESREAFQQGLFNPRALLYNTTSPDRFATVAPVSECSQRPLLTSLCVSVIPSHGDWHGSDATGIAYVVLIAVVCPAVLLLSIYGVIRAIVGPETDPLKYAPRRSPVHAVCVDLPDANRMWSEVPFIMHDVTMTFAKHMDLLASENRVYVTLRLGCTAVAVTNSRERALAFARAFAEWAQNFAWPPHIMVHCPRGSLHFAVMLHTMENVAVRFDREQGQCEVTGDDMKALLLLRVAAVEQHVMCTGEFLGLPSLYARMDRHEIEVIEHTTEARHEGKSTNDGSTLTTSSAIIRYVGKVGELGGLQLRPRGPLHAAQHALHLPERARRGHARPGSAKTVLNNILSG